MWQPAASAFLQWLGPTLTDIRHVKEELNNGSHLLELQQQQYHMHVWFDYQYRLLAELVI